MTSAATSSGSPLRVMLVNANFEDGTVGGTQTFTRNLANWLAADGHRVAVLCQGDRDSFETRSGVEIFRVRPPCLSLGTNGNLTYLVNQSLAIHNPAVGPKADSVVRRFRPDVCHVQMLRRLTPAVLRVLRHRRVPVVQTVHELFSLWNFNAYQREDTPDKIYSRRPRVVGAFKWWHRRLSAAVHHVCAPSEFALRSYLADGYFPGVPATVLPHSVPWEWGEPRAAASRRAEVGREAMGTSFLFLGRLDHYKGIECLLASLDALVDLDIQLHIAGAGVLEPSVRRRAERDPRVRFHGPVHDEHRRSLYQNADVLVCPTTWVETFGLVVLEAHAAGLPVIVSRAGALHELIDDGVTGLVVEPASPSTLADAMRQMHAPDRRYTMARAAAEHAMSLTPDDFLRCQVSIYRQAIARTTDSYRVRRLRATTVTSWRL